jgi:hypothetical protein
MLPSSSTHCKAKAGARKNNSAAYARLGPGAIAGVGGAGVEMAAGNPSPGRDDEQCEQARGGFCWARGAAGMGARADGCAGVGEA